MKNKASKLVKQVFSTIVTIVKAKSLMVKSKTSALKTRLAIFGLLHNKKLLMTTISYKIQQALTHQGGAGTSTAEAAADHEEQKHEAAMIAAPYNVSERSKMAACFEGEGEEEDDEYPDLRHCLFDMGVDEEDDELDDIDNGEGSVIDMVRNVYSREDGKDFRLEDEIDHVADVFIRRFHKQMRLQKLDSFKSFQEMLDRSV